MSIFGAMSTAISGLDAQAAAFSNISDNVANSQTVGFKSINTSFTDFLTTSTAIQNQSGSVASRPDYQNNVQGSIQQSNDALALAISGKGFFAISEQAGNNGIGQPTFSPQSYYTRAGDFKLDKNGYLVNGDGGFLNGWAVNAAGTLDTSKLVPIQISQTQYQPAATSQVQISANVPATPGTTSNLSSQIQVYDATGTPHALDLTWKQTSTNNWTLSLAAPDNTPSSAIGSINVTFNTNGTLNSLNGATGAVADTSTGTTTSLSFTPNFGSGAQPISLVLGQPGASTGVTQFAGTDYAPLNTSQNGVPPGSFTGITTQTNGDVVVNYNNGVSATVAKIPIATFANPDELQRQNGQAFTATTPSGSANVQVDNTNGAGGLVTGSVESSNVDIATELAKLIVAQQAYGANAKMITAANQLMVTTIDMKQ